MRFPLMPQANAARALKPGSALQPPGDPDMHISKRRRLEKGHGDAEPCVDARLRDHNP
jgi:hypothetical protein